MEHIKIFIVFISTESRALMHNKEETIPYKVIDAQVYLIIIIYTS